MSGLHPAGKVGGEGDITNQTEEADKHDDVGERNDLDSYDPDCLSGGNLQLRVMRRKRTGEGDLLTGTGIALKICREESASLLVWWWFI